MTGILDIFSPLFEFIELIYNLVINVFTGLFGVVKMLGFVMGEINTIFVWIPAPITRILVMTLGVAIFYKVLGREG